MSAPDPRMRWWGWGVDADAPPMPESTEQLLAAAFGVEATAPGPPSLDAVELPEPRLDGALRSRLAEAVGAENLRDDRLARVAHAYGRSYPDLVRLRLGRLDNAPALVVYPGDHHEVRAVLAACSEAGVEVVPFGGGTSVVGGVEPSGPGAVSLDLARMASLIEIDPVSRSARLGPGMTGPEAEAALAEHGMTLGHFPQSWEYATIGGFAATRSAGQASTGYGRFDELVLGLRVATPSGELSVAPFPGTAAGPSLREVLVGSEGVLGVITEVTVRVRPAPEARVYEGWSFKTWDEGVAAFRELEQSDASPQIARLSDQDETRLTMAMARSGGLGRKVRERWMRFRGHDDGCLVVFGFEGESAEVAEGRARAASIARAGGGMRLGKRVGEAWRRGRYRGGPYLRDELIARGIMAETLETATSWSNLDRLYAAVRAALRESLEERGTPPVVMCHVSHLYPSGASLYYTFIARQEAGAEIEQWHAAKSAACDAIVAGGGTITHHHAIGRDHVPWMEAEVGEEGVALLRALKGRVDPRGVMNPGKLIP